MAQVNPKLNLNKTPALADNNSLIFAKNIRLDVDSTIHRDYGTIPMSFKYNNNSDIPTDYNNIFKRIIADVEANINSDIYLDKVNINILLDKLKKLNNSKIVGHISSSNEFYLFISDDIYNSIIVRYNEKEDRFEICNCNWNYNGGVITGHLVNNLRGEKILNIGEYKDDILIPFKSINLNKSKMTDDESIYTQTPNIPITNLNYKKAFNYVIPNGVYQFFVRYKIREGFYTDWFPASKELFAGNNNMTATSFGTIKYSDIHKDSDNSFTFDVKHLYSEYYKNYESFQIGFIVSHDDTIVGRGWKHFSFNDEIINFDYNAKDSEEIEIIDFLKSSYQIYNVKNIANFKNKLYISNYKETDFNDSTLQSYADKITMQLSSPEEVNGTVNGYPAKIEYINGNNCAISVTIDGEEKTIPELTKAYLSNSGSSSYISYAEALTRAMNNEINIPKHYGDIYGMKPDANCSLQDLEYLKDIERAKYKSSSYSDIEITFNDDITQILGSVEGTSYFGTINATNANEVINHLCDITQYICKHTSYNYGLFYDGKLFRTEFHVYLRRSYTVKGTFTNSSGQSSTINDVKTYDQTVNMPLPRFAVDFGEKLNIAYTNISTLMPYQNYKFFIHFVKSSGEITNGYECTNIGEVEIPYEANAKLISPIFNNIEVPKDYAACFFSIIRSKNIVSTVYNVKNENGLVPDTREASCIDINLGLTPANKNIHIKQDDKEWNDFNYYYSSDSTYPRYFGADGILASTSPITFRENKLAYLINEYTISEIENIELVKCTPYIKRGISTFEDNSNMNLLSFICEIYSLDRDTTMEYYTDGTSVFHKDNWRSAPTPSKFDFELTELKNHLGDTTKDALKITALELKKTNYNLIYSNYNLNLINLAIEPIHRFISYYEGSSDDYMSDDVEDKEAKKSKEAKNMALRLFPSLTMSSIYELPQMYKEYTRKYFYPYTTNNYTSFDNTIRSSILEGDESFINIFKFGAEDYYNIPTNRGIIINMISVGDSILVHTEDSMFRFSGSNNLQSSEGEIVPSETNVFDTGVSEVFGSDFGFAGLQIKTDSIVTELGYFFFDRDSRIVYLYSGQGQIIKISDSIEKLFRHKDIKNIYFANDYYNNRIFLCIIFIENNIEYPVTLSFSTINDIKSFVSLHDFYYYKAFNTKTKCYFITKDNKDICNIDKRYKACYTKLELLNDKTYPSKKEDITIKTINNNEESTYNAGCYDSILDIINNTNFEIVKTLNTVKWCSNIVENEFVEIDNNSIETLKIAEEELNEKVPCKYLKIYTDTCSTPLNTFVDKSNNYNITSLNSYMYPRFNQGYWSFNYFRNIQNANGNVNPYVSDENSLIEGKYIVCRFGFDKEFKFETLTLLFNNKL